MSRRNEVAGYTARQAQHAGLWLDKYFGASTPENAESAVKKAQLVSDVAGIATPSDYSEFFDRWKAALTQAGVVEKNMREAEVVARLAVGLGGEAVLETAITLHRTYGVPYIPGSALKGLASSYADKRLEGETWRKKDGKAHHILFGNTKTAGYVTFFDALYVPGSGAKNGGRSQALWPDVITVHHPDYYGGKNSAPADWDSPTPVPFLTATGKYLIAIGGPPAWVEKAFEILANALAEEGIGAKTSSGYGRMRIEGISVMVETKPGEANASASPQRVETATRRGIVLRIDASKGGTVRENTTEQEFHFAVRVIEGDFPGRGKPVHFRTQDDEVVHLKRA
ncbi:MAG: type III-B CRISPR module RAMP protein Cmr6 [Anaerolineae bacterium]